MKRKIDDLHERHLANPPTRKEEAEAEKAWVSANMRLGILRSNMVRAVSRQKELAQSKRDHATKCARELAEMSAELEALKERHARRCSALEKQETLFVGQASKAYDTILSLAAESAEAKAELDKAAERLVLTHGIGPIQLHRKTYDFGCHGERVYLVPRARQSMPKKGK